MSQIDSPDPEPAAITSVRDLIDLWPSLSAFADDISVPYDTAKGMRRRNAIASDYFVAVVEGATRREIADVTFERLAKLHAKPTSTQTEPAPCPAP